MLTTNTVSSGPNMKRRQCAEGITAITPGRIIIYPLYYLEVEAGNYKGTELKLYHAVSIHGQWMGVNVNNSAVK